MRLKKIAIFILVALGALILFLYSSSRMRTGDKYSPKPLKNQDEQTKFMLKHMTYDHLHTWDYQDVDYELLAAIISKENAVSYNDCVKNSVKSLGLKQIKDYAEVEKDEIPQPMVNNVSWRKVTLTTSSDFGAGNLFMSPKDY